MRGHRSGRRFRVGSRLKGVHSGGVAVSIRKDEGPDAMCEGYAVTVKGLGHLGGMARGGAQAVKGPLHADRCVQQYGLLVRRTVRAGAGSAGDWDRSSGRLSSWGSRYAAECPSQRAHDLEPKANREKTTSQTGALGHERGSAG
jgi:hypothetical protein